MHAIRASLCAGLIVVVCGIAGCQAKAVPAPGGGAAGGAPGGAAGAPAGQAPAAANPAAPAAGSGAVPPGSAKIDAQIQQKLLALGAKLKQDGGSGEVTKNDLKQIGLAFHNFHDTFNGFPALNGTGNPDMKNSALSWRVMLLPFLDEAPLYQKFHLDEPWDSPHNKSLIAEMPKVYGRNPEGKTQVHVLTGNGAPFRNDQKVGLRDITDGSSNTIMAVAAGPDTAEIWTKPGGLEFDPKQPMKCLGNIGNSFEAVFMDGAVHKLPKSIAAEQFALLVQNSDGMPIAEIPRVNPLGSRPGEGGPAKINPPVTPLAPVSPKIDLSFIPADAFFAAVLHPRRVISHPIVEKIRAQFPRQGVEELVPGGMVHEMRQLGSMRDQLGIAVENLDEVVVVLDKSLPEAMLANPFAPPPFGVVAKNSAPLDVDALIRVVMSGPEGMSIVDHEGVALILAPGPGGSAHGLRPPPPPVFAHPPAVEKAAAPDFPEKTAAPKDDPCQVELAAPKDGDHGHAGHAHGDPEHPMNAPDRFAVAIVSDSIVLFGSESVLRKMVSARASTTPTTELTKQLDKLGNPLFALSVDAKPLEKGLKTVIKTLPPEAALFSPFILGVKSSNIAWDLDGKDFLNIAVQFRTPELAQGLFGMLDAQYKNVKDEYPMAKQMLAEDPTSAGLWPYADQVVADAKLSLAGDTVSYVVPQIKNLDKLPDALKPAVEKANQAADDAQHRNNLKQIGLGFHNYHDVFQTFPAVNGSGIKEQPRLGLSWRVHILPFIDQAPLYNQFKLDEPWDSPHNKALISKMPPVFGKNSEGKTTIHVFTGPGAPFQNDEGVSIAKFVDGTSNTFLAIEGPAESADIWTKPNALTFDPADPLKVLGDLKEFQVLFADGYVRKIKNIDKENFARAVQLGDGEVLQLPE